MLKQAYRVTLNIVMGMGGILAALILLEIGVRLLPPPYDNPNEDTISVVCSDELGWRGKPNYETTLNTDGYKHLVRHNSVGLHDTEHQLSKPENTFRILILGDSFAWAGHVDETETAHQILENLLNDQITYEHFEVINSGVTGWGTGQELIYYRHHGRLYEPDLVLLLFYFGNDVEDNLPGEARTLNGQNCYGPYFVICNNQLDIDPWRQAPGVKSALGQCSTSRKILTNVLGKIYQSSRLYANIEPLFAADQARSQDSPYYPLYIPEKNESLDYAWRWQYAWQLTVAIIDQLHQEIERDGAELVVVLVSPADVIRLSQMDSDELEAVYQKVPDLRKAQIDLPNQKLSETLSGKGIHVFDLQPSFIQHAKNSENSLYFPQDKHWNVEGNRFAAKLMYDWLNGHNLLNKN